MTRWHPDFDPHPIRISTALVRMRLFNSNPAADQSGVKLIESVGASPDQFLEVSRFVDLTKT
jgi:hypothetical protein